MISISLFLDEDWDSFDAFVREVVCNKGLQLKTNPLAAVADPRMPGSFLQGGKIIALDRQNGFIAVVLHTGQVLALLIISKELITPGGAAPQKLYYRDTIRLREWEPFLEANPSNQFWCLGWGTLSECLDDHGWILDVKHNNPVVLENIIARWWLIKFLILQAAISRLKNDLECANPAKFLPNASKSRLLKYKFEILSNHVQLFDQFIGQNEHPVQPSLSDELISRARATLKISRNNLKSAGINLIPKTPHIFISSTRGGLNKAREAVRDALLANGFFPEMMEQFPSEDSGSKEACLQHVEQCDGLVLLLGGRYGWRPAEDDLCSITKLEWLEAGRLNIGRAVVLFEDAATPQESIEEDEIAKRELDKWKKELKENLVILVLKSDDITWLPRLMASVLKFSVKK